MQGEDNKQQRNAYHFKPVLSVHVSISRHSSNDILEIQGIHGVNKKINWQNPNTDQEDEQWPKKDP